MDTGPGDFNIIWLNIATEPDTIMLDGSNDGGPDAHIWIEHDVAFVGQRQNEFFDKFDRELTGMHCLFNVIIFYILKNPHVTGILAKWVPRKLTDFWPLEVFFVRIFSLTASQLSMSTLS